MTLDEAIDIEQERLALLDKVREQNDLISAIKQELSIGDTVSRSYRAMELIKEYER